MRSHLCYKSVLELMTRFYLPYVVDYQDIGERYSPYLGTGNAA